MTPSSRVSPRPMKSHGNDYIWGCAYHNRGGTHENYYKIVAPKSSEFKGSLVEAACPNLMNGNATHTDVHETPWFARQLFGSSIVERALAPGGATWRDGLAPRLEFKDSAIDLHLADGLDVPAQDLGVLVHQDRRAHQ